MKKTATIIAGVLLGLLCAGHSARAQGIPHDWSHHHLIFSKPRNAQQDQALEHNPRYRMQQLWRQGQSAAGASAAQMQSLDALAVQLANSRSLKQQKPHPSPSPAPTPGGSLNSDWSVNMGSGAKVGAGMYPAKFSFNPIGPANCDSAANPDFVVYNTGLAGSATQASIIAYDNLYSGCTGTVPLVYWQYNTGGKITTSVALSSDGSQVAFVQNTSLVLLKWAKSSTLATPTSVTAANYRTCTAPCMTTFTLTNNDSNSAPFVDYVPDNLYVGDDLGKLYKFTGVFNGTPAAGSSAVVSSGNKLTSPVHDGGSGMGGGTGRTFVADSAGHLISVSSDFATVTTSAAVTGSPGIVDAPLFDSSAGANGTVYVFSPNDGGVVNSFGQGCNGSQHCSSVRQFAGNFTANTSGTEQALDRSTSPAIYDGAFDNSYMNSSNSTGSLYVCGSSGGSPKLYQVLLNANVMSAGSSLVLTSAGTTCSPVTEFDNSSTDRIFLSVQASGNKSGCTGACVYSFDVTGTFPLTSSAGLAATGGSSGIIIDNSATSTGASQVYFSTLGTGTCGGGCAVQASQSALQ